MPSHIIRERREFSWRRNTNFGSKLQVLCVHTCSALQHTREEELNLTHNVINRVKYKFVVLTNYQHIRAFEKKYFMKLKNRKMYGFIIEWKNYPLLF